MVITRNLQFSGSKGETDLEALFDSGSTYSCVSPEVAAALAVVTPMRQPLDVETASKGVLMRIQEKAILEFMLNGLRLSDEFMIVPNLSEEAIIGATTMQKWKIKLDFEHDQVVTDPRASRLILK